MFWPFSVLGVCLALLFAMGYACALGDTWMAAKAVALFASYAFGMWTGMEVKS